jgi:TRAP-type C4-dicarboxylate transport system permease small subunit
MAYTLQQNAHVRVDIFYAGFSTVTKAWVDLCGALFLLLPFMLFITWSSWQYILDSWAVIGRVFIEKLNLADDLTIKPAGLYPDRSQYRNYPAK